MRVGLPRITSAAPPQFPRSELTKGGFGVLHTPLQFYMAALGMRFAASPFAVRAPFAITGAIAVLATAFVAEHTLAGAGVFAAAAMVQVPYLLLIRQARYYAPVLLGSALLMLGAVMDAPVIVGVAAVLLVLSEWSGFLASAAGMLAGIALADWPVDLALPLVPGLLIAVVWLSLRRSVPRIVPRHERRLDGYLETFWIYFWKLQCQFIPIVTIFAFAALGGALRPSNVLTGSMWLIGAHLALRASSPAVFARYLSGALVPAAIATAILLTQIASESLFVSVLLAGLTVTTDVLHRLPLFVPDQITSKLAFVRSPDGIHLTRVAMSDTRRPPRLLLGLFIRELVRPPVLRTGGLVSVLMPRSRVLIGQSEAAALQVAAPTLEVVPWGLRPKLETRWLATHPPDYVVLGDLDAPERAIAVLGDTYERATLPVVDVLMANGETLERHFFDARGLPVGVEALRRCHSA